MIKFKAVFTKNTMSVVMTSKQEFEFEAKTLRSAKMKASKLAGYVGVCDYLRLYDEHGSQIDVKTYDEWVYGITEMPSIPVDEVPEAKEETLMTYSYFHAKGAKVNSKDAYIEDIIVLDRKNDDKPAGYVFYKWVHVATGLIMYVKPSQRLLERAKQVMGYTIVAMVPKTLPDGSVRLVGTFQTDLPGFSHEAVLGDMPKSDADTIDAIALDHELNAIIE